MPPLDSLAVCRPQVDPPGATVGAANRSAVVRQREPDLPRDGPRQEPGRGAGDPVRVLGAGAPQLEADVEKASALLHKSLVEVLMVGREADFYSSPPSCSRADAARVHRRQAARGAASVQGRVQPGHPRGQRPEKAAFAFYEGRARPTSESTAPGVKVADLGLSRTLTPLGRRGRPTTPEQVYVAPEVGRARRPTASDVYPWA
jgi:hypothetical protein